MITNQIIERSFQAASAVLIMAAGYFYFAGDYDMLFVAAVFGSLCLFVSVRFQVKERLAQRAEALEIDLLAAESPEANNELEEPELEPIQTDQRE